MANSTTAAKRGATPDTVVDRDQWILFCVEFTRQNRGAHAVLEVLGGEVGYQVDSEDRPFDGISIDVRDDEDKGLDHIRRHTGISSHAWYQ